MKTIYLIGILVMFFSSCKKEVPETTISGIVVNYGTLQPIDSMLVTVISGAGKGTFGDTKGSGSEVSVYTDMNGKFTVTIKGDNLFLYMKKERYRYDDEIFGAYKSYTAGRVYSNEVLKLNAYAIFDGYFYCPSCLDTDSSYLIDDDYIKNGKITGGEGNELHIGKGVFNFRGGIIPGDTYFGYGILHQTQGVWQPLKMDSVYVKSFETYTDTIYY